MQVRIYFFLANTLEQLNIFILYRYDQ